MRMELTITLIIKFALSVQVIFALFNAVKFFRKISFYSNLSLFQNHNQDINLLSLPSWRLG